MESIIKQHEYSREYSCIREHITLCGEYMIVHCYPVRSLSTKKTRQKKYRSTRSVQAKLNEKNSRRKLTGLIHTNFTPSDSVISLTYDRNHLPKNSEAAHTEMYNFIRRIKRIWSKTTGKDVSQFKYIEVMETGKKGRIHHHLILSGGLNRVQIHKSWGKGDTSAEHLQFDENGVVGLAKYLTKPNSRIRYKRWSASKNLEKPCTVIHNDRLSHKDVRFINENPLNYTHIESLYPGYTVCPYSVETTANEDIQIAPFVSFMMYKTDNRYFQRDKYGRLHRPREFTDVWKSIKPKNLPTKSEYLMGSYDASASAVK